MPSDYRRRPKRRLIAKTAVAIVIQCPDRLSVNMSLLQALYRNRAVPYLSTTAIHEDPRRLRTRPGNATNEWKSAASCAKPTALTGDSGCAAFDPGVVNAMRRWRSKIISEASVNMTSSISRWQPRASISPPTLIRRFNFRDLPAVWSWQNSQWCKTTACFRGQNGRDDLHVVGAADMLHDWP